MARTNRSVPILDRCPHPIPSSILARTMHEVVRRTDRTPCSDWTSAWDRGTTDGTDFPGRGISAKVKAQRGGSGPGPGGTATVQRTVAESAASMEGVDDELQRKDRRQDSARTVWHPEYSGAGGLGGIHVRGTLRARFRPFIPQGRRADLGEEGLVVMAAPVARAVLPSRMDWTQGDKDATLWRGLQNHRDSVRCPPRTSGRSGGGPFVGRVRCRLVPGSCHGRSSPGGGGSCLSRAGPADGSVCFHPGVHRRVVGFREGSGVPGCSPAGRDSPARRPAGPTPPGAKPPWNGISTHRRRWYGSMTNRKGTPGLEIMWALDEIPGKPPMELVSPIKPGDPSGSALATESGDWARGSTRPGRSWQSSTGIYMPATAGFLPGPSS